MSAHSPADQLTGGRAAAFVNDVYRGAIGIALDVQLAIEDHLVKRQNRRWRLDALGVRSPNDPPFVLKVGDVFVLCSADGASWELVT